MFKLFLLSFLMIISGGSYASAAATNVANVNTEFTGRDLVKIKKELFAYMDNMRYIKADFAQTMSRDKSSGSVVIRYPNTVTISYRDPRKIDLIYSKKKPGVFLYHDLVSGQEKYIRMRFHAVSLLVEPSLGKVVQVNSVSYKDKLIIAQVEYKGEDIELQFSRSPSLTLQSLRTSFVDGGRRVGVMIELNNIKALPAA